VSQGRNNAPTWLCSTALVSGGSPCTFDMTEKHILALSGTLHFLVNALPRKMRIANQPIVKDIHCTANNTEHIDRFCMVDFEANRIS
jgi:hypothetical protein